jgi:hypothetical protein
MPFIQYSPELSPLCFGYFTCRACQHQFYGAGCVALHGSDCAEGESYDNTVYVFGDRETWKLLREIPMPTADEIRRAIAAPGTAVALRPP